MKLNRDRLDRAIKKAFSGCRRLRRSLRRFLMWEIFECKELVKFFEKNTVQIYWDML